MVIDDEIYALMTPHISSVRAGNLEIKDEIELFMDSLCVILER